VHVQVLALNDLHGNLEPPHGHDGFVVAAGGEHIPAGGAAYLSAHVQRLRAKNPNTVVVSAGDLTGASPLVSSLFGDEPTVLVMNHLGLDFEGVGNHDFDHGLDELRRLQTGGPPRGGPVSPDSGAPGTFAGARFEYLAANVLGSDGKTVFPPYAIKQLGGVSVAFVGMTLEGTPTVTTKDAIRGLSFANEAAAANALLPELRARGVAATVILVHQGGFQDEGGSYDSCTGLKGDILKVLRDLDPSFRVVVTAHTHQAYDCTLGDRLVTSAGSYGRLITAIDLTIDPAENKLVDAHAANVPVTHDIEPDPVVTDLVAAHEARARPITARVVGHMRGGLTRDPKTAHSSSCETPLGDVIADAQLAATASAGAVIALMNPGGVRTDLTAHAAPGTAEPIHYAEAFEVQPFGNRLVTLTLSGAQLRALLERQFAGDRPRVMSVSKGFTYSYVFDRASKAVTIDPASIQLRGHRVDPAKSYRVTVNSFLADGGDGFSALRDADARTVGALDLDALVDYLTRTTSPSAPLTPPKPDRVKGNACQ
jgi:5'-nucleotidase